VEGKGMEGRGGRGKGKRRGKGKGRGRKGLVPPPMTCLHDAPVVKLERIFNNHISSVNPH